MRARGLLASGEEGSASGEERVAQGILQAGRALFGGAVEVLELGLQVTTPGLQGVFGVLDFELGLESADGFHEGLVGGAGLDHLGGVTSAVVIFPEVVVGDDDAACRPEAHPVRVVGGMEEVTQLRALDAPGPLLGGDGFQGSHDFQGSVEAGPAHAGGVEEDELGGDGDDFSCQLEAGVFVHALILRQRGGHVRQLGAAVAGDNGRHGLVAGKEAAGQCPA